MQLRPGEAPRRAARRDRPESEPAGRARYRSDRGSTLVLAPVGMLILLLLATMTADGALALLGQRQLADALTSATSDAAGAGIDRAVFYRTGQVVLAPTATAETVCESLAAQGDLHLDHLRLWIGISGPRVTLAGRAEVRGIFGRAIPGYDNSWDVAATATATAEEAPRSPLPVPEPTDPLLC